MRDGAFLRLHASPAAADEELGNGSRTFPFLDQCTPCRDSYNAEVGRGLMSQDAEGNAMWKSKLLRGERQEGCYTCLARPLLSLSFRRAVGGGRGGGHELLRSNRWTRDRTTTTEWWTLSATLPSRKLLPPNVDSAFQPFISSLLFLKVLCLLELACLPFQAATQGR